MNIMFLIFSHNIGGIERLLIDMANEMSQRGHHVHLCVINKDYSSDLLNNYHQDVSIYTLDKPIGSKNFLKYMIQFAEITKKAKIDILHCQGINCVVFSIFAKLLSHKLILLDTVHDTHTFVRYAPWKVLLEKKLCKKIIAISESVKTEIISRNVPLAQVHVIHNAINVIKFHNDQPKPFHKDSVILGNVARIMPAKKGQLLLLEAIKELKKDYPNIHCYFAGGVSPEYQDAFQMLQDYVEQHQLSDNISFFGSVENVPSFLQSINIFVLPSFFEGFGISLIEAMSMGLPCIASNIDGPSEIIQRPDLGVLFESGNVDDLVGKLKMVIENYNSFIPEHISSYITSRFSIDTMVSSLLQLYTQ